MTLSQENTQLTNWLALTKILAQSENSPNQQKYQPLREDKIREIPERPLPSHALIACTGCNE